MSRQLAIAAAFSVFALSALALFAPVAEADDGWQQAGATSVLAAPEFTVELPLAD